MWFGRRESELKVATIRPLYFCEGVEGVRWGQGTYL